MGRTVLLAETSIYMAYDSRDPFVDLTFRYSMPGEQMEIWSYFWWSCAFREPPPSQDILKGAEGATPWRHKGCNEKTKFQGSSL